MVKYRKKRNRNRSATSTDILLNRTMPGHGTPIFETGIMRPGYGRRIAIANSYQEIRAAVDPRQCSVVLATGYQSAGDGGWRFFSWHPSLQDGDDDSVFLTSDFYPQTLGGRWKQC